MRWWGRVERLRHHSRNERRPDLRTDDEPDVDADDESHRNTDHQPYGNANHLRIGELYMPLGDDVVGSA